MTKIKCIALERSNLTNLAKAIEEFQNTHNLVSLGSIPFSNLENGVGVIMFFPSLEKGQVGEKSPSNNSSPKAQKSKEKFITPESWKSKEPTLKQRTALKRMGLDWDKINSMNMYDASKKIGGEE